MIDLDRVERLGLASGEFWVEWIGHEEDVHILKAADSLDAACQAAEYFDRSSELNELHVEVVAWNGNVNTVDLEAICVKQWDAKLVRT